MMILRVQLYHLSPEAILFVGCVLGGVAAYLFVLFVLPFIARLVNHG